MNLADVRHYLDIVGHALPLVELLLGNDASGGRVVRDIVRHEPPDAAEAEVALYFYGSPVVIVEGKASFSDFERVLSRRECETVVVSLTDGIFGECPLVYSRCDVNGWFDDVNGPGIKPRSVSFL